MPTAWWNPIRDVIALWAQWLVMLGILVIYLVITFAIKPSGCPRGYIGPGGLADIEAYENCTGGIAGSIDRYLFGSKHIYQHPTCMKTYKTMVPYDPEGALGTLTSSFLVFLGVQAGYTLFTFPNHVARMKRWIFWSIILVSSPAFRVIWVNVTCSLVFCFLFFFFVDFDCLSWAR